VGKGTCSPRDAARALFDLSGFRVLKTDVLLIDAPGRVLDQIRGPRCPPTHHGSKVPWTPPWISWCAGPSGPPFRAVGTPRRRRVRADRPRSAPRGGAAAGRVGQFAGCAFDETADISRLLSWLRDRDHER
jgi:hypothetical protein